VLAQIEFVPTNALGEQSYIQICKEHKFKKVCPYILPTKRAKNHKRKEEEEIGG